MNGKAEIQVSVEMPDDLMQAFIQHIRNFDAAHEGCHFRMAIKADGKSAAEMEEMFASIDPPFVHVEAYRKQ